MREDKNNMNTGKKCLKNRKKLAEETRKLMANVLIFFVVIPLKSYFSYQKYIENMKMLLIPSKSIQMNCAHFFCDSRLDECLFFVLVDFLHFNSQRLSSLAKNAL